MWKIRNLINALTITFFCACSARTVEMPEASTNEAPITYTLPPLPYSANALEPHIDARTMTIHHSKHHQSYVDNLNKALKGTPEQKVALESILASASASPPALRNNAGGHWNHTFFWTIMTPAARSAAPSPKLLDAINASYGSFDAFKERFTSESMSRFGSGWTWLIKTPNGLEILSTPNQDNPLMDVASIRGQPILALDLWEHAYYLKYQNKRAEYVRNWWNVVNWPEVSRLYEQQ